MLSLTTFSLIVFLLIIIALSLYCVSDVQGLEVNNLMPFQMSWVDTCLIMS